MFTNTYNKGFQLEMKNGWTVSVQWGVGNYCSRRWEDNFDAPRKDDYWQSNTAEIAAWKTDSPRREWYSFGEEEDVKGYCNVQEVTDFICLIASLPSVSDEPVVAHTV